MVVFILLFILFTIIVYEILNRDQNKCGKLPKGPWSIPILGSIPLLGKNPIKGFVKLRKSCGDMHTFNFGSFEALIVHDWKIQRDLFKTQSGSLTTGRTKSKVFQMRCEDSHGVLFSTGQTWQDQRRYAVKTLKDFGFGQKSMEEIIQTEVAELIKGFEKDLNIPIDLSHRFNVPSINSIWTICTGKRSEHDNPVLVKLYENITKSIEIMFILYLFPWLFKWDKLISWAITTPITKYGQNCKESLQLMRDIVRDHKKTFVPNISRDFVDVYLKEIYNTNDPNSTFYRETGEKNLIAIMNDLFLASGETTSTTMIWAFLLLALNPDKQKKLKNEISSVAGPLSTIKLEHKSRMIYAEAVTQEVLRFSALIPFTYRVTNEEIKYDKWIIPKGTTIMGNFDAALWDKKYWKDPENFRPERFISDTNGSIIKHEAFVAFSLGKRNCLGEPLARDTIFLFLTNIIQKFQVITDPNMKCKPNLEDRIIGGVQKPKVIFPVIFKNWKSKFEFKISNV